MKSKRCFKDSKKYVITGMGVVAPNGIGYADFFKALSSGNNAVFKVEEFPVKDFLVNLGAEVKGFDPKVLLGPKGLRNIDRSALFLMAASKEAIEQAQLVINESTTDDIGVCTGTTFSHFSPIYKFDKEVFDEGMDFANPALFPSTVINAASSQVSIRFKIQGYNTTLSTGYSSGLSALEYSLNTLRCGRAKAALVGGVDTLTSAQFFGFHKLGYMAGIKGVALSCPFDKRRNGPILGEAAGMCCVEEENNAKKRKAVIQARIAGIGSYFDSYKIGKIHPEGEGLEKAIKEALDNAKINPEDIDYISSCANSSQDLDRIEVRVLKKIFGNSIKKIPISSIKSMIGETFSPAGILQIIACSGAIQHGVIPPTINYEKSDENCDIDCIPNKAQKKDVKAALITSFGPGGYNSACVLTKY